MMLTFIAWVVVVVFTFRRLFDAGDGMYALRGEMVGGFRLRIR